MSAFFPFGRFSRLIRSRLSLAAAVTVGVTLTTLAVVPGPGEAAPPVLSGQARIDWLVSQMTLAEKVDMIAGAAEPAATNQYQAGYLPGVPRLGIPSLRLA